MTNDKRPATNEHLLRPQQLLRAEKIDLFFVCVCACGQNLFFVFLLRLLGSSCKWRSQVGRSGRGRSVRSHSTSHRTQGSIQMPLAVGLVWCSSYSDLWNTGHLNNLKQSRLSRDESAETDATASDAFLHSQPIPTTVCKLISAGRDRASAPSEIPLVMHGCHTTRTEKMQSWKEVCAEAENSILSECISSVAQGTENDYAKAGSKEPIPSEWNNKQ